MSTPTRRRITLLDGLMLIAATAVGLTLMRFSINGIRDHPLARSGGALIQSQITAGQTYASCFLAPWSPALLALHFRKAGAPSRRETWGPGFIACVAATTGLAVRGPQFDASRDGKTVAIPGHTLHDHGGFLQLRRRHGRWCLVVTDAGLAMAR
jgi:hypothetical protein